MSFFYEECRLHPFSFIITPQGVLEETILSFASKVQLDFGDLCDIGSSGEVIIIFILRNCKVIEEMEGNISKSSKSSKSSKLIYADDEIKEFCKRLPKLELNANLTGSLSMSTIFTLYNNQRQRYPYMESFEQYSHQFQLPKTLQQYNNLNIINEWLTGTPDSIITAICDVIKEFLDDNTIYLELKVTPQPICASLSKELYILSVIHAVRIARNLLPRIIVKIIFSIDRAHDYEDFNDICDLVLKYHTLYPDIIVGIDLCGDPLKNSPYYDILNKCRNNGMKIVMHCAEIPYHTETWEMIEFGPDRLTHCTCVHPYFDGADYLFEKLLDSKIPIELCLTSNVERKKVKSYAEHHFKYLYKHEHPISICTGEKGICKTTLSKEYAIAATTFNLSKRDLLNLSNLSLLLSFTDNHEKNFLLDILQTFENTELLEKP